MFRPNSTNLDDVVAFSITESRREAGVAVVTVRGELDIATAPALRQRLSGVIEADARRLVLDLLGVSFIDSTALAVILGAKTRLGDTGRLALVVAPDSYGRLLLEVVGLLGVLDVVETLDEGIEVVRAHAP